MSSATPQLDVPNSPATRGGVGCSDWLERRVCKSCEKEKPDSEYYAHPGGLRGRRTRCKECCKKWNRTPNHRANSIKWNAKNKRKKSEIASAYKATERGRKMRRDNKAKCRANLSPSYVGWCVTQKTKLKTRDVPKPLIEAAAAVIKLKRILWQHQRTSKNSGQTCLMYISGSRQTRAAQVSARK